ncbi:hypothetical protein PG996_008312 [Apiospora saccharicola]|uniref:Uncharacterized protein n=1 Tax=Apiospora saccharicola TaxID=335842 RepID=A0ABR1UXL0_9PEZI
MVSTLTFVATVYKDTRANQLTTRISTVPPDQAWPYRIQAFPLQMPARTAGPDVSGFGVGGSSSVPSGPVPSGTVAKTTEDNTDVTPKVSRGQVAGISVGVIVFMGFIVALAVVQVRSRRRRHGQLEPPVTDVPRAELEGTKMYPEMDNERELVEAPYMEGQYPSPGIDRGADVAKEEGKPSQQSLPDFGKGKRISIG